MPPRYLEAKSELIQLYHENRTHSRDGITTREYKKPKFKGANIIHNQDDIGEILRLLTVGRVMLTHRDAPDRSVAAVLVKAPSLLAEPITTNATIPRLYTATVFEDARIIEIQRKKLSMYLMEDPGLTKAILSGANGDIDTLSHSQIALSGNSAEQRAAYSFLRATEAGDLLWEGTQEELGDLSGVTRAEINKVLGRWMDSEWIGPTRLIWRIPRYNTRSITVTEVGRRALKLLAEGSRPEDIQEQLKAPLPS